MIKLILMCWVVRYINIYGHLVDAFILLDQKGLTSRLISPKIRRLVHVKPNSWKLNLIIKSIQLCFPKSWSFWVKIIYKMNLARPNFTNIVGISLLWTAQENIQLLSFLHGNRIFGWNPHINKRHKMNLMSFHHFVQSLMSERIYSKNHLLVHIVQIWPNGVDW